MTITVDRMFSPAAPRFTARYPWDRWFAAGGFTARRGEDFAGRTDTFILQVRQQAGRRRTGVHVEVSDDGAEVRVTTTERRKP